MSSGAVADPAALQITFTGIFFPYRVRQHSVDAELIEGSRGESTVWVDDRVVARKSASGFPSDADPLEAVQRALCV